jgi:hypothetical protein
VPLRRDLAISAVAATVVVATVASGCTAPGSPKYPATAALEPLPTGEAVIANKTFPPGGSDNWGTRVIAIELPAGMTVAAGERALDEALRARGWTVSTCAPKGDPCAVIGFTSTQLADAYGGSAQPEVTKLVGELGNARQPTFLVQLVEV